MVCCSPSVPDSQLIYLPAAVAAAASQIGIGDRASARYPLPPSPPPSLRLEHTRSARATHTQSQQQQQQAWLCFFSFVFVFVFVFCRPSAASHSFKRALSFSLSLFGHVQHWPTRELCAIVAAHQVCLFVVRVRTHSPLSLSRHSEALSVSCSPAFLLFLLLLLSCDNFGVGLKVSRRLECWPPASALA